MRARRRFELRLHGESAAIQLNIRRFGDRGDLLGRRESAELVEFDAIGIHRARFSERISILYREERLVRHHRHAVRRAPDFGHAFEIAARDRLLDVAQAHSPELAYRRQRIGQRPARIRVHADRHVAAHRLAHSLEVPDVMTPPAAVGHLQAQHPDTELVDGAFRLRNHGRGFLRHAHRPLERNARLAQPAQEVVKRLVRGFAHRVAHRDIEYCPRRRVVGKARVEHFVDRFDVEDRLADEGRAIDLLDGGDHAVRRVGDEVPRADGPDLRAAHDAVGVDFHEHGLGEQPLRRSRVIAAAREDALHPHRQGGHMNFDAIDHCFIHPGLKPRQSGAPPPASMSRTRWRPSAQSRSAITISMQPGILHAVAISVETAVGLRHRPALHDVSPAPLVRFVLVELPLIGRTRRSFSGRQAGAPVIRANFASRSRLRWRLRGGRRLRRS